MGKVLQYAKLDLPRLHRPVFRLRLFDLLDRLDVHRVVWVSGPPGAGKSTLAATYVDDRKRPCVWYQIDEGDRDPATFFFYLREAASRLGSSEKLPPLLTPEYLGDLPGFARLFFRSFFSQVPAGCILVLDNFHDLQDRDQLVELIACALFEIPKALSVFVLSRELPPARFAHALLCDRIVCVDWDDLRFTLDETQQLASRRGVPDHELVRGIHERADGWAAGARLMLESAAGKGNDGTGLMPQALEVVFDYFSTAILAELDAETQRELLRLSCLPRLPADLLKELTGSDRLQQQLRELHRRNLFTTRIASDPHCYQFHALLRQFLCKRASIEFTLEERRQTLMTAGRALRRQGEIEAALQLLVDARDWDACQELLSEYAPSLLAQGRWQTVQASILEFPAEYLRANPWLGYWLGASVTATDVGKACEIHAEAHRGFEVLGDEVGQTLCAASILSGLYFQFSEFSRMDVWIDVLQEVMQSPPRLNPGTELFVVSAFLNACGLRRPEIDLLPHLFERATKLLEQETIDPPMRVLAGTLVLASCSYCGRFDLGRRVAHLVDPLANLPEITALNQSFWCFKRSFFEGMVGDPKEAAAISSRGHAIAREHGLAHLLLPTRAMEVYNLHQARELTRARSGLHEMRQLLRADSAMDRAQYENLMASQLILEGVAQQALPHMRAALKAIVQVQSPWFDFIWNMYASVAACTADSFDLAEGYLKEAARLLDSHRMNYFSVMLQAGEAYRLLRMGEVATAHRRIAQLMREGAERGGVENLRWLPILREVLLVEALSEEVADLARAFIRNHRIPPPPSAPAHWPWPLRIRTFGRFSIERDGVPLRFDRKAPHKVLAVLKALIARGGDAVPLARLADDVWPDEDGDAAQHSCVMAIHRLRKLLGERDILVVEDGLVTLDRSRIFVDALELLAAPDRQRNQDELFALYGGDFLPEETDCRWAAAPRERLRGKFVAAISRTGRDLEQGAQFCAAAHLYQRGIDATPLTEELYQGLIRCSVAEQRWADAYASYERLRSVLTTTLNRQPSLATERLLQPLMTGNTRLSLVSAAASSSRAQKSPQK